MLDLATKKSKPKRSPSLPPASLAQCASPDSVRLALLSHVRCETFHMGRNQDTWTHLEMPTGFALALPPPKKKRLASHPQGKEHKRTARNQCSYHPYYHPSDSNSSPLGLVHRVPPQLPQFRRGPLRARQAVVHLASVVGREASRRSGNSYFFPPLSS